MVRLDLDEENTERPGQTVEDGQLSPERVGRVQRNNLNAPHTQSQENLEFLENRHHRGDDSALGSSRPQSSGSFGSINLQEPPCLPRSIRHVLQLSFIFRLLHVFVPMYSFRMRFISSWLPHYITVNYEENARQNNVASTREADAGPAVSQYDCESFASLSDDFQPFEQNQLYLPQLNAPRLSTAEIRTIQIASGTWRDPLFPQYCTFSSRISSFNGELVQLAGVFLETQQLADSGFFLTNTGGFSTIQCFHCGCSIRIWEEWMNPMTEHILLRPEHLRTKL